jgi:hypothetical protein
MGRRVGFRGIRGEVHAGLAKMGWRLPHPIRLAPRDTFPSFAGEGRVTKEPAVIAAAVAAQLLIARG